jgi:hypothetical protein
MAHKAHVVVPRRQRAVARLMHLTSGVPCDKVLSPTTGALRGDGRARWGGGLLTVEDR